MDERAYRLAVGVLLCGTLIIVLAAITGFEIHPAFWSVLGGISTYALVKGDKNGPPG